MVITNAPALRQAMVRYDAPDKQLFKQLQKTLIAPD